MTPGNLVYHVLNRANARMRIFQKEEDYLAFERVVEEALEQVSMRMLAYAVMPNHWHMVLWPDEDNQLPEFMHWLSMTHAQRWHAHYHTVGAGHLYQGRFKSFVIQNDDSVLRVCRYVERNALRAGLVDRAENWRWGSLWKREHEEKHAAKLLSKWPVEPPEDWLTLVNQADHAVELESIRQSAIRSRPFGEESWVAQMADTLGLRSTLRLRGRPPRNGS